MPRTRTVIVRIWNSTLLVPSSVFVAVACLSAAAVLLAGIPRPQASNQDPTITRFASTAARVEYAPNPTATPTRPAGTRASTVRVQGRPRSADRRVESTTAGPTQRTSPSASAGPTDSRAKAHPTHQHPTVSPSRPVRPSGSSVGWGAPVFSDDFSGTALDPSQWYSAAAAGLAPQQSPTPPPAVQVGSGRLDLVGTATEPPGSGSPVDRDGAVLAVASQRHQQAYGRWEVRFRQDRGAGYAPSISLRPAGGLAGQGGIDLALIPRGDRQSAVSVVTSGPLGGAGGMVSRTGPTMRADFSQWHVMAVDWLPDRVTIWLDGRAQWTVARPARSTEPSALPRGRPMGLVLELSHGCGWIECPNAATPRSVALQVDWVRGYRAPS